MNTPLMDIAVPDGLAPMGLLAVTQEGEALGSSPASESGTQADGSPGPGGNQPPPTGGGFGQLFIFLPLIGLLIFMMIASGRKQKKEQRARQEMLASIRRFDRVQTVGGVIGTVQELTEDELVLRVDEDSGTRVRFSRSSVQQVLESKGVGSAAGEASEPQMASQGT